MRGDRTEPNRTRLRRVRQCELIVRQLTPVVSAVIVAMAVEMASCGPASRAASAQTSANVIVCGCSQPSLRTDERRPGSTRTDASLQTTHHHGPSRPQVGSDGDREYT